MEQNTNNFENDKQQKPTFDTKQEEARAMMSDEKKNVENKKIDGAAFNDEFAFALDALRRTPPAANIKFPPLDLPSIPPPDLTGFRIFEHILNKSPPSSITENINRYCFGGRNSSHPGNSSTTLAVSEQSTAPLVSLPKLEQQQKPKEISTKNIDTKDSFSCSGTNLTSSSTLQPEKAPEDSGLATISQNKIKQSIWTRKDSDDNKPSTYCNLTTEPTGLPLNPISALYDNSAWEPLKLPFATNHNKFQPYELPLIDFPEFTGIPVFDHILKKNYPPSSTESINCSSFASRVSSHPTSSSTGLPVSEQSTAPLVTVPKLEQQLKPKEISTTNIDTKNNSVCSGTNLASSTTLKPGKAPEESAKAVSEQCTAPPLSLPKLKQQQIPKQIPISPANIESGLADSRENLEASSGLQFCRIPLPVGSKPNSRVVNIEGRIKQIENFPVVKEEEPEIQQLPVNTPPPATEKSEEEFDFEIVEIPTTEELAAQGDLPIQPDGRQSLTKKQLLLMTDALCSDSD